MTEANALAVRWRLLPVSYVGLGLVSYGAMNYELVRYIIQDFQTRSVYKSIALCGFFLIGFFGLLIGYSAIPRRIRFVALSLMTLAVTANFSLTLISKRIINLNTAVWLMSEVNNVPNILIEFHQKIGIAFIWASLALGSILIFHALLRREFYLRLKSQHVKKLESSGLLAFILVPLLNLVWPQSRGQVESNIYSLAIPAFFQPAPLPGELSRTPTAAPAADKIILVIDESVRPDVFEKLVRSRHTDQFVNFDNSRSTTNCSGASNAYMRWGVNPAKIAVWNDPRTNITLWTYAKGAGYATTLVDGQVRKSTQNFLRDAELRQIDNYLPMEAGPETDAQIAAALKRRLALAGKEFIYVVKRGAHFPYEDNLPAALRGSDRSRWETYQAAVAYSTGKFFTTLLEEPASDPPALVFYTSDHGQYMGEGASHCRGDHLPDEFKVPLSVVGPRGRFMDELRSSAACWRGAVSHQNLRTAVIESFGYDKAELEIDYFPSLTSCRNQPRIPIFLGSLPFPTNRNNFPTMRLVDAIEIKPD